MRSQLDTFDGLDNRREVMLLLQRLGTDARRAQFLESLIPMSAKMSGLPMKVKGKCDPVAAYFMFISVCNEIGVPINDAARRLEKAVKRCEA